MQFDVYYNGTPKQRGDDYLPNVIRVGVQGGKPLVIEAADEFAALAIVKSKFPFLGSKLMVGARS